MITALKRALCDKHLIILLIPENGFEAAEGIFYHYLNDEKQPQSEYLTEMYIPVKKA